MFEKDHRGKMIKWAAKVPNTKEVVLMGHLDLAAANDHLAPFGLKAKDCEGNAEAWITVGDLVWKGFRFQELSTVLMLESPDARILHAPSFLVHAYNTNRFFAWSERVFFKTPYLQGDVGIDAEREATISLAIKGEQVFFAQSSADAEATELKGERNLDCAVFLPSGRPERHNLFYAKLEGEGHFWPWSDADRLELNAHPKCPDFTLLKEGNFQPIEWSLRLSALHQKSKTRKHRIQA